METKIIYNMQEYLAVERPEIAKFACKQMN